eukprot:Seg2024.6 transcript_id=Seg2024.6/GoldUCD/mRNA.D3Y31 product="Meiosis-specific with OB domain-containing protein" protein_id=Seg2024.6/GoldUCD/D3Y31
MQQNQQSSSNTEIRWPDGSSVGPTSINEMQRESIRHLRAGILKGVIAGLIIAKQDARSFVDKKNPSQMRWLLNFTIRDSPEDFINISCWGGGTFINDLAKSFRIGDLVEVKNVLVQCKQNTEAEEKYNVWTPSPFNLLANETHAVIERYNGPDYAEFSSIAFLPVKESGDYYTLADVIANGHNFNCLHINILAALRDVGNSKEILTKTGKTLQRRELTIFDETCVSFPLLTWDNELNEMASGWNPRETDIPEAHHLYNYAQSIDITDERFMNDPQHTSINVENIQDLFSIEELQDKINDMDDQNDIYGILFACITNLDVDSSEGEDKILIFKCCSCKRIISKKTGICNNDHCVSSNQNPVIKQLDLRIDLSDVTGGMANFKLQGINAEKFLGHNVDEVLALDLNERTALKWKHLFDRYKIFFKCVRGRHGGQQCYLDILSIEHFDVSDRQRYQTKIC